MDAEIILTGYCRCLDQSRIVTGEVYHAEASADCSYPDCPYIPACQIGQSLENFFSEHTCTP